jgi:hypothetical protein
MGDHYLIFLAHRKVAAALQELDRVDEARSHAQQAVAIVRRMGLPSCAFNDLGFKCEARLVAVEKVLALQSCDASSSAAAAEGVP